MIKQQVYFLGIVLFLMAVSARASTAPLKLDQFLDQVLNQNKAAMGSVNIVQGSKERSLEGDAQVKPQLVANATLNRDAQPLFSIFFPSTIGYGLAIERDTYSLGVQQNFDFGLNWSFNFNTLHTVATGLNNFSPTAPAFVEMWQIQPTLNMKFSLWRNFLGRELKSSLDLSESSALITHYSERYKLKSQLVDAENAYWRLVIARKALAIRKELLGRAQALQAWSARRTQMSLGDKADAYQADAILELRTLELQAAVDEERMASQAFNLARGIAGDKVEAELSELPIDEDGSLPALTKVGPRDDVLVARENQKVAVATHVAAIEKLKPNLDLTGAVVMNGTNTNTGTAFSQVTALSYPTTTVGLALTAPLDLGLVSRSKVGHEKESVGADWILERKLFEEEQDWNEILLKFEESKRKFKLAASIERLQKEKLTYERDRLLRGRTTTNMVIQFEQDYSQAVLSKFLSQVEVTQIYAKMKLLGGSKFEAIDKETTL